MGFKTDIEIAQETTMAPITEVAAKAGIDAKYLEQYGNYKAKIDYNMLKETDKKDGKLILVTAINPTPAGEGKTTTTVGLADGMSRMGKSVCVALREPSLGPVFGVKGGAAGGGYAQVVPMEDINLHFTGDFHAIGAANNLLAAMLDNHIYQGNALNIDPRKITWRRCVDMNEIITVRLRSSGKTGLARKDERHAQRGRLRSRQIASEIMAVLCLAKRHQRPEGTSLSHVVVGYTYGKVAEQTPVTAGDLNAQEAITCTVKGCPQTQPGTELWSTHRRSFAADPFANVAHGCNSVLRHQDGSENSAIMPIAQSQASAQTNLGAEKFLDIKCRMAGLKPSAVVIVATVRALKYNGGAAEGRTEQ